MAELINKKYRVPKTAITEKGLKKLIQKSVKDSGKSASQWATEKGLTAQSVSAFLTDRQTAGLKIPEVLGYVPQVIYLPVDEDEITVPKPPRRVAVKPTRKADHTKDPIEKKGFNRDDRQKTKDALKKRAKAKVKR